MRRGHICEGRRGGWRADRRSVVNTDRPKPEVRAGGRVADVKEVRIVEILDNLRDGWRAEETTAGSHRRRRCGHRSACHLRLDAARQGKRDVVPEVVLRG